MNDTLEGAPVLCRTCGAPTEAQADGATVHCRFCGTVERMPPDAFGRALEIRGRLVLAASRVAQLASTEAALARIFERRGAFVSVMGAMPAVAIFVVAYAAFGAWSTLSALPASVPDTTRLEILLGAAYGPFFIVGLTLSFPVALFVGRVSYRRKVRPLLAALPPFFHGAPMRCRACGGALPIVRDPFVDCRFCRTQNLLGEQAANDARRRLDEEIHRYRTRAGAVLAGTSQTAIRMTRTLIVCFALVYGGILALGAAAELAVTSL